MHWSIASLALLLATSASAMPLGVSIDTEATLAGGLEVSAPEFANHVKRLANNVEHLANNIEDAVEDTGNDITRPMKDMFVPRDIKKGWFNPQEAATLQKASETNVNFNNLMDTLYPLSKILDKNGVPWAVAGGLALKIHGQRNRYTSDIDIIVQTTMPRLRSFLSKEANYLLPSDKWPSDSHIRVYHNQGTTARPKYIEIDLVIAGTLTSPQQLKPNILDFIKTTTAGTSFTVHVLRLNKIFVSKVWALAAAHRAKDDKDMKDISWIIEKTPGSLKNVQRELSYDMRQLVIMHLVRLQSPIVKSARELLGVLPTARLHDVPTPQIVGINSHQPKDFVSWLFDSSPSDNRSWW